MSIRLLFFLSLVFQGHIFTIQHHTLESWHEGVNWTLEYEVLCSLGEIALQLSAVISLLYHLGHLGKTQYVITPVVQFNAARYINKYKKNSFLPLFSLHPILQDKNPLSRKLEATQSGIFSTMNHKKWQRYKRNEQIHHYPGRVQFTSMKNSKSKTVATTKTLKTQKILLMQID